MPEPPSPPPTAADLLVQRLAAHGVRHIFGYPGGQLTPIYDALYRQTAIRHVLARDEQAAAFMADGYARATGRSGVCLAVCGPGVYNAATALATAYTDSVPLLLISGQVPSNGLGLRSGYYHENDQRHACTTLTKWAGQALSVDTVVPALDRALALTTQGRPGPVLLEVPLDVLRREASMAPASAPLPTPAEPPTPPASAVELLADLLARWRRPLLLAGGGVSASGAEEALAQVAERLGAPVLTTLMGKCALRGDHPLAAGLTWHRATQDVANMKDCFSPLLAAADGVLAVGCRFSQAATGTWELPVPSLAQIDGKRDRVGRLVGVPGQAESVPTFRRRPKAVEHDRRERRGEEDDRSVACLVPVGADVVLVAAVIEPVCLGPGCRPRSLPGGRVKGGVGRVHVPLELCPGQVEGGADGVEPVGLAVLRQQLGERGADAEQVVRCVLQGGADPGGAAPRCRCRGAMSRGEARLRGAAVTGRHVRRGSGGGEAPAPHRRDNDRDNHPNDNRPHPTLHGYLRYDSFMSLADAAADQKCDGGLVAAAAARVRR